MAYPVVSAPYGLKPYNLIGGRVYAGSTRMVPIASGYATNLFFGDVVQLSAGTLVATTAVATGAQAPVPGTVGIFVGCEYSPAGGPRFRAWRDPDCLDHARSPPPSQ